MIGRAHDNVLSRRFAFVRGTTRQGGTDATKGVVIAILVAACSSPAAPVITDPPVPVITPAATLAPIFGSGFITFGTSYDPDTLAITAPKSSFKVGSKKIAWSAELSEAADATSLTWIIARQRASGVETILIKQELDIGNPTSDILANTNDLSLAVDRAPGTYVMRLLRGSEILAEGTFKLVK